MSKQVHFQLPFQSLDGISYRIDIYGEGSPDGGIKQLIGSADPFVTDEDSSDDFFEPVRKQTGVIHIVNEGLLSLADILPGNNVERPVKVWNVTANAVEWQGFLSCESYSQDYTARPHMIDLNVNSMLTTLDSIHMPLSMSTGITNIRQVIANVLELATSDGVHNYRYVYYPVESENILTKKVDVTTFFELKEQAQENSLIYEAVGMSVGEIVSRVCAFMGWTLRERGLDIFFTHQQTTGKMRRKLFSVFKSGNNLSSLVDITTEEMSGLSWAGASHKATTIQGSKSVELVANVEPYKLDMQLPECPLGDFDVEYTQLYTDYIYAMMSKNVNPYQGRIAFAYYSASLRPQYAKGLNVAASSMTNMIDNSLIKAKRNSPASKSAQTLGESQRFHAGALLAKAVFDDGAQTYHEVTDGLYLCMFPGMVSDGTNVPVFPASSVGPIFTINTILPCTFNTGYINLKTHAEEIAAASSDTWLGDHAQAGTREAFGGHDDRSPEAFTLALQFGDMYWNGSSWQNSECTFVVDFENGNFTSNWNGDMPIEETDGYLIPITKYLHGVVTLKIYPQQGYAKAAEGTFAYGRFASEFFVDVLTVSYIVTKDNFRTDRGKNTYYKLMGLNFRDEQSTSIDLASDLSNLPSPSLIMEDDYTAIKSLTYNTSDGTESRRPEKDLLDRMVSYYSAPRTSVTIEVEDTNGLMLPLRRFEGFDGKKYAPLSESRNWRTGVRDITCFEIPE